MSHHYSGPDWGFPRGDARLDLTDLYAFPKPGDSDKSILIMNVHPSPGENPPGPTTPEPFAAVRSRLTQMPTLSRISRTGCASHLLRVGRRPRRCAALKVSRPAE